MKINNLKDILNMENRSQHFVGFLVIVTLISLIIFGLLLLKQTSLSDKEQERVVTNNSFQELTLKARGVIVWDIVNQKAIFSKNPNLPLPLASLTKVMTALTAQEKVGHREYIEIAKENLSPEGDSKLIVGDVWKVDDLLDFTLLTSSNDGAAALAGTIDVVNPETGLHSQFINAMNQVAALVGLSNSRFWNEHGLDRDLNRGGSYGSARDMALLFEYILKNHPHLLEATRYNNLEFRSAASVYLAQNTNDFIDNIPNVLASKTGFTDLAGGNLVVAFDPGLNRPIIVAVLGSTEGGRFNDVLQLVEATMSQIQNE